MIYMIVIIMCGNYSDENDKWRKPFVWACAKIVAVI